MLTLSVFGNTHVKVLAGFLSAFSGSQKQVTKLFRRRRIIGENREAKQILIDVWSVINRDSGLQFRVCW